MMIINFNLNSYNLQPNKTSKSYNQSQSNINFTANTPEKIIDKILAIKEVKNIKLNFKEISKVYQYLGYDIVLKGGSHAIVRLPNKINLPIIIPHKEKYVHPNDIKRLKFVLLNKFDEIINIH